MPSGHSLLDGDFNGGARSLNHSCWAMEGWFPEYFVACLISHALFANGITHLLCSVRALDWCLERPILMPPTKQSFDVLAAPAFWAMKLGTVVRGRSARYLDPPGISKEYDKESGQLATWAYLLCILRPL